jgi:NitT/TauT family transport system ATP-binding protein
MIAGFEKPTVGRVEVGGVGVVAPGPDRAVVSQQPNLFPWKNVRQNVMYSPRLRGATSSDEVLCSKYLSSIGLQGFQDRYPYELSGGMQQRVSIARALMCQPNVLLMDEPFGGLDAQTKLVMQELILSLWKDLHTTIFLITHDVDEALLLGHRVAVMSARPGRIIYEVEVDLQENREIDVTTTSEFIEQKRELLNHVREQTKLQIAEAGSGIN